MIRVDRHKQNSAVGWTNLIDRCPHCKRGLIGHFYSLLASDVVERKDVQAGLNEFFESLKQHDWPKLFSFQRWEGLSDNVELYGILCGTDSVVLVVVRSPFELYDSDEILAIEALHQNDSKALLGLAKDKDWKTID